MISLEQFNNRPAMVEREARLQRSVLAYIVTGLIFMLLPGTFLGVWNLISISGRKSLETLSPAWIQAHGHAQIFGWIGTFIIGIGYYSLSKMGNLPAFAVRRAWCSWALWTTGVALRWSANVTSWQWRIALPVSALLELAGFLIFFLSVSRHKADSAATKPKQPKPAWMLVVVASTCGFLFTLLLNLFACWHTALSSDTPAFAHLLDQRMLTVPVWTFLVPTVWGFNARWLPVFLGIREPDRHKLLAATGIAWGGALCALWGYGLTGAVLVLCSALLAAFALHIARKSDRPAKTVGIHGSFPFFVRAAWFWLIAGGVLTVWAASADRAGGIWGASRHAITVGFLAAMIFAIGPRILPAFCGGRVLFSKELMFVSLLLLHVGCAMRVISEIPAYEGFAGAQIFWHILPCSGVMELAAVAVFAANMLATFTMPPAHLAGRPPQTTNPILAVPR
jgi:uncharacterized protein involved in response to NO